MVKQEIKNIFIGSTGYSLLLYILLKENWRNSLIITDLTDHNLIKNLKKQVKDIYIYKQVKIKKNMFKFYLEKFKLIYYLILKKYYFNKNIEIYGVDNKNYSVLKRRGYYIIEDGLNDYLKKNLTFFQIMKQLILLNNPFQYSFGYSFHVKKAYFSQKERLNIHLDSKVKIVNLEKLWDKKEKEEREEILKLFNFKKLKTLETKKNILLTQPLSEDGFISENEKIEIYKKIIRKYEKNSIVIKSHPREKTKYKNYFSDCHILEGNYPLELLTLEGVVFRRVITIFSTAAFNFGKNTEINFYGTRVHPKLLEKWGDSDLIMKANAFLAEEE